MGETVPDGPSLGLGRGGKATFTETGMTVALVTGGSGFVGRFLVRELVAAGYRVHATYHGERPRPEAYPAGVTWWPLDVVVPADWQAVLEDVCPDAIFHLAGLAHVGRSWQDPHRYLQVNFWGTFYLMDALVRADRRPRVLLVGSAEVYGSVRPEENPIRETQPLRPVSPYGLSKACQELLGFQYYQAYQIPVIVTRSFNHVGPGQHSGFVCADFASQIARIEAGGAEPVLRVGNLEAVRDFTDVRDIARAYRLLVERGRPGEAYNVCSGRGVSIRDLLQELLRLASVPIRVETDPRRYRRVDIPVLVGDPTKIRDHTGWVPTYAFQQTLADILDEWRRGRRGTSDEP